MYISIHVNICIYKYIYICIYVYIYIWILLRGATLEAKQKTQGKDARDI